MEWEMIITTNRKQEKKLTFTLDQKNHCHISEQKDKNEGAKYQFHHLSFYFILKLWKLFKKRKKKKKPAVSQRRRFSRLLLLVQHYY